MFDLPQEFVDGIRNAMNGDKIELPFAAPILWWLTGKPGYKKDGSSAYFGGWAGTAEDVENAVQAMGVSLPTAFKRITMVNNEGKEYDVFCTRSAAVAIIAKRTRWIVDEQTQHSRSHTQVLCYMAEFDKEKKAYIPWGPVVLSAKALSGKALEDSFREWDKKTAAARRQYAKNLPPWFFYAPIGTFGDKPNTKMVGSGQQSPITPAQVYTPEEIGEAQLTAWFVGPDVAAIMADLKGQAKEWLEAWKVDKKAAVAENASPEAPSNFDDDVPF
jgi:hypothetical protein